MSSGITWHSNVQLAFTCPVAPSHAHSPSHAQSRPVAPSHAQSRPVTPSHTQWQQVATGVARLHLVAVRSHFGLRLDGRNNPARASNRPGRRIKGGGLLPGWVKPPPNPPPVLVIVSDILDSEIHDRTRVLYSYSYLRGSYEIEADLTMH